MKLGWAGLTAAMLLAGGIAAHAGEAQPPGASPEAPKGDVANGKKLYTSDGCWQCHGTVGQGARTGPTLINPMPYAAYMVQLRSPSREMPPYEPKLLSDQEAADIYAYMKTFPEPPDYKTIKLLQVN
jgi:ubiquinol-cytochrome c reductase cytochrome c subunit